MNARDATDVISLFVDEAMLVGPKDWFTQLAYLINTILKMIFTFPFLIIAPITTFILGLLIRCSFGLLLIPLSFIWLVFLGFLIATSWLWIHVWILRPVLLIPGIFIAVVGYAYCTLVPDMGEKFQKVLKLSFCDSWPYSYLLLKIHNRSGITD